jgi:hypothetical protein
MESKFILSAYCNKVVQEGGWRKLVSVPGEGPFLVRLPGEDIHESNLGEYALESEVFYPERSGISESLMETLETRTTILVGDQFMKVRPTARVTRAEFSIAAGRAIYLYIDKLFGKDLGKAAFQMILCSQDKIIVYPDDKEVKSFRNWFEFYENGLANGYFDKPGHYLGTVVCPGRNKFCSGPVDLSEIGGFGKEEQEFFLYASGYERNGANMMGILADQPVRHLQYKSAAIILNAIHNAGMYDNPGKPDDDTLNKLYDHLWLLHENECSQE